MPDHTTARYRAALRPVPDYEPRVDQPRATPSTEGQLALSLRRTSDALPCAGQHAVDRPNDATLTRLLCALVEVADGRRPVHGLRKQLSFAVHGQLRSRPVTPIGGLFTIKWVHCHVVSARRLELCATVHNPPRLQAFATLATLERQHAGWLVTSFSMLLPTATAEPGRRAG